MSSGKRWPNLLFAQYPAQPMESDVSALLFLKIKLGSLHTICYSSVLAAPCSVSCFVLHSVTSLSIKRGLNSQLWAAVLAVNKTSTKGINWEVPKAYTGVHLHVGVLFCTHNRDCLPQILFILSCNYLQCQKMLVLGAQGRARLLFSPAGLPQNH